MPFDREFQDKQGNVRKKRAYQEAEGRPQKASEAPEPHGLMALQDQVGNAVVQGLLVQRRQNEPAALDEDTADQIDRERSSGQPLDSSVQQQMEAGIGQDFSKVQVHTSPEADALSQKLGARAFTTGRDIFFRQGAYDPHSSAGQELLAHELTHVVQQSAGAVSSTGSQMTVNAPDDRHEQEADAVARAVTGSAEGVSQPVGAAGTTVARQEEEQEEAVQLQVEEEEETLQLQPEEEPLPESEAAAELPPVEEEMAETGPPEELVEEEVDLVQTQPEEELPEPTQEAAPVEDALEEEI